MGVRVRYRKAWERRFPRTRGGRRMFTATAGRLERRVATKLAETGLADDPPAREYKRELFHEPTRTGARVGTTASRAHFVEWGTVDRQPDAPMRLAAREFGTRFIEN